MGFLFDVLGLVHLAMGPIPRSAGQQNASALPRLSACPAQAGLPRSGERPRPAGYPRRLAEDVRRCRRDADTSRIEGLKNDAEMINISRLAVAN